MVTWTKKRTLKGFEGPPVKRSNPPRDNVSSANTDATKPGETDREVRSHWIRATLLRAFTATIATKAVRGSARWKTNIVPAIVASCPRTAHQRKRSTHRKVIAGVDRNEEGAGERSITGGPQHSKPSVPEVGASLHAS